MQSVVLCRLLFCEQVSKPGVIRARVSFIDVPGQMRSPHH